MEDKKLWHFYEELNEIVYVVDMDTYEIVYMNRRARNLYGISDEEAYQGKRCYELLAGSQSPCAVCCDKKLESGYFLEEVRYNPVIKKRLAFKETVIEEDGKRYRFILAVDVGTEMSPNQACESNDAIINEGLRISLSASTPEKSINVLLGYLGLIFNSDRVYIFEETDKGSFCNTYEWCASGVMPQKENLQDVPFDVLRLWYERFQAGKNIFIKDLEKIRETDPEVYEYLHPQNIQSLIVSPIVRDKKIIGFYGLDNPPEEVLDHITTMFQIWGHFMDSLLRRRNLVRRLEEMCFQDQLTGVGNRHAMHEYIAAMHPGRSVGILYCDVMGLKRANDTKGHQNGDQLLIRAGQCLQKEFNGYALFRVGGDEFLVLCEGITEEEMYRKIKTLKTDMIKAEAAMALGHVWKPDGSVDMDYLITQADQKMYEDKREWYKKESRII